MKINKEGSTIIPIAGAVFAIVAVALCFLLRHAPSWTWVVVWGLALVGWGFIIAFFREPDRPHVTDDRLVYSPCDGTVVVCEDVTETEVLKDRRMQVSIFMSITNVHINWFPVGGEITYFKHHHGKFMVAWHPKSSDANEHTTTAVRTPHALVVFRQVAGLVARRIVSYARVGEQAEQNRKCGFIKFGSRVDLFLPLDCEILVGLGEKVTGSQTPIARLK